MSEERVSYNTLFDGDPLERWRQEIEKTLEANKELEKSFRDLAAATKSKLSGGTPENIKALKEQVVLIEQANKIEKSNEQLKRERIKVEKEVISQILAEEKHISDERRKNNLNELKLQNERIKIKQEEIKVEQKINRERERADKLTEQENKKLREQSGIYGQLLQQRKNLKSAILGAKTIDELKALNNELFKVNGKIKDVKEAGTKAFNSWSNALSSFQFKFNSLGQFFGQFLANAAWSAVSEILSEITDRVVNLAKETIFLSEAWVKNNSALDGTIIKNKELRDIYDEQLKKIRDINIEDEVASGKTTKFQGEVKKQFLDERAQINKIRKDLAIKQAEIASDPYNIAANASTIGLITALQTDAAIEAEKVITKIQEAGIKERSKMAKEEGKRLFDEKQKQAKKIKEIEVKAEKKKEIGRVELKDLFGNILQGESQTLEQFEKEEKEKTDAQIEAYKDRQKALDEFVDYELKAIEGLYGDEERIISLARLERNILDDSANDKEREAWKKLQQEKIDTFKKANEEIISNSKELSKIISEIIDSSNDYQIDANARKISELDRQIDFQRQRALNGDLNSLDALESERAKEIESREKLRKKQANIERGEKLAGLFLEFYKIYAKDKENAMGKAMKETGRAAAGESLVKKLFAGSFEEGTENTGVNTSSGLDGKGGRVAIVHDKEAIITKRANMSAPGLSSAWLRRGVAGVEDWVMNRPKRNKLNQNEKYNGYDYIGKTIKDGFDELNKNLDNKKDLEFKRNVVNELVVIETRNKTTTENTIHIPSYTYKKR